MKREQLFMLAIIVIAVILGIGIVYVIFYQMSPKEAEISLQYEQEELKICKAENCPAGNEDTYGKILLKSDIDELNEIVDNINDQTEEYYQKAKNSTFDDAQCAHLKDMYQHSDRTTMDTYLYNGDQYIGISVLWTTWNMCTNPTKTDTFETYTYDLKNKRMMTQDLLKEEMKVTDENISYMIENDLEQFNQMNGTAYTLEDVYEDGTLSYTLFFRYDGDLLAMYHLKPANTNRIVTAVSTQKLVD